MWGEIVPSNIKEGQRPGENLKKVWLQNSAFEFDIVFQNCCWNRCSLHHEYFIKLTAVFFSMSVYLIVQRTFLFTLKTDQIHRVRVERWSRLHWWFPTRNARSWIWMPLHISLWRPKTRNGLKCSLWSSWELNLYILISGKLLKELTITSYHINISILTRKKLDPKLPSPYFYLINCYYSNF